MTNQKIGEKLLKVEEKIDKLQAQLKNLQLRKKELEEQKYIAETAEAMRAIKKYKIPAERLQYLNMLKEEEILQLLEQKENEQKEKEQTDYEKTVIN